MSLGAWTKKSLMRKLNGAAIKTNVQSSLQFIFALYLYLKWEFFALFWFFIYCAVYEKNDVNFTQIK